MAETISIGKAVPRLDGAEKVSGASVYVDDIRRAGMLHGAYLLSPYPHARILAIDTSGVSIWPV